MLAPALVSLALHQFAPLVIAGASPTDPTGINTAFENLAKLFATAIGGVIAFFIVVEGYLYITTLDDVQKGMHAKRALGAMLFGAMLVVLGVTIGPLIATTVK